MITHSLSRLKSTYYNLRVVMMVCVMSVCTYISFHSGLFPLLCTTPFRDESWRESKRGGVLGPWRWLIFCFFIYIRSHGRYNIYESLPQLIVYYPENSVIDSFFLPFFKFDLFDLKHKNKTDIKHRASLLRQLEWAEQASPASNMNRDLIE